MTIEELIAENELRNKASVFNPITGEGSVGERFKFALTDYPVRYYPIAMRDNGLVTQLVKDGSIQKFIENSGEQYNETTRMSVIKGLVRERIKHDYPYWCAAFIKIKDKESGADIPFKLNQPQRKLIATYERLRLQGNPILIILLKARQWGGSTATQIYMAWIQLVHKVGFSSAIVAHLVKAAINIREMFTKMIENYPPELLGLQPTPALKLSPFGKSPSDRCVTQGGKQLRNFVISIGSMQSPDSIRSGDIAMAHFSEVGVWVETDKRKPKDVIRSVSSSILRRPYAVDVMESTAKGEHNMFHKEWIAAKRGESSRTPVFVAWFEIELYRSPFASEESKLEFARFILEGKEQTESNSTRCECGAYLWKLWQLGASLEAINWYVDKRADYDDHDSMASEFPSDDIEAFAHSGDGVFDITQVERLRDDCRKPSFVGEIVGDDVRGENALRNIRFVESQQGILKIWEMPDTSFKASDRYLVVTDVGGRSDKADYSDILVIDRWWRTEGEGDVVVAEWHGHIRHDLLAWKMAQIASFYNNALLVVESNTYETKDNDHYNEGDMTEFILEQIGKAYPNMYAREASAEKVKQGILTMWGFQTNRKNKPSLISNLNVCIAEHLYTEREEEALYEYNCYQLNNGVYEAALGEHDDRVMVRAIAFWISDKMPLPKRVIGEAKRSDLTKTNAVASSL